MSCVDLVLLLIVAAVCGSIAESICGYTRGGCLVSIAIGFVGALVGVLLSRLTGLPELLALQFGDFGFPLVWSILGATLFVALIAVVRRRPWGGRPGDYYD